MKESFLEDKVCFEKFFESLSEPEGHAILTFLRGFKEAHGADFPFGEIDKAISRYFLKF